MWCSIAGNIILAPERLPFCPWSEFVWNERRVIKARFGDLHSVVVPLSGIHEAPPICRSSFESITDPWQCFITQFMIIPLEGQEWRYLTRCFQRIAACSKQDTTGISDLSLLDWERYRFGKVRPPEVQYACWHCTSHLSRTKAGETRTMEAPERPATRPPLWFEAMSRLGSVSHAADSIEDVYRWVACVFLIGL